MRWIALHSNLVSHVTRFVHILHWRLTIDDDTLITLHCTHVFFLQYLFLVPSLSHHPIEYKCICLPVMPWCVMSCQQDLQEFVQWPGLGALTSTSTMCSSTSFVPYTTIPSWWWLVAGGWFCLHYVNVPVHNKPRMHHTVHYTVVTNQRIESIMICVWFHSSLLLHVHVLYIQQDLIRAKQPNHPINRYSY